MAVLNDERPLAKFVLVDDRIVAQVYLPGLPFAPEQLRRMLAMMCELADEVDDNLAVRVSGRRFFEPDDELETEEEDESSDIHPAMATLLQLDAQSPGSIKPSLAARACQNDPELLLTLITWSEEQETEWRAARDHSAEADGLEGEAIFCERERAQARRTTKLLRKALRLVVGKDRCERR